MPQASAADPAQERVSAPAWPTAGAAALLLTAGAPGMLPHPEWAGLLVLPGLAFLFRLLVARRAALLAYVAGVAHMGAFSWSVHHVLFAAWLGIALVGGLYFAVLPLWVRGLSALRVPAALAFGAAVAGAAWLRTYMPEITYPHAQPVHALFCWPGLLGGAVGLGGEVLGNLLLAALAVALADLCRRGRRRVGAWTLAALLGCGLVLHALRQRPEAGRTLTVAAVQPGIDGSPGWLLRASADELARWQGARLTEPTRVHGRGTDAVDLVLWPEGATFADVVPETWAHRGTPAAEASLVRSPHWLAAAPLPLAPNTRLLLGGHIAEGPSYGVAAGILVDARGKLLGYHEKVRLVPGGERQPFLGWLPESWSRALRDGLARAIGAAPHLLGGRVRPPLPVAEGVRLGTLICYDNAFPDVTRRYVEAGANLLAVLSNEMWYQRGAELVQMEAMTVLRALEANVPIVRATMDGATLAVGADGRVRARLAHGPAGVLRVAVEVPERGGPVAPMAPALGVACALSLGLAAAHVLLAWVRLRRPLRRIDHPAASALPR